MIKLFIQITRVLVPISILYVCLCFIIGQFKLEKYVGTVYNAEGGYGHLQTRLKDVIKVEEIDILILGSSHAYEGIDPEIFESSGIKAFNLGSSAQTPFGSYYLFKNYMNLIKPKFVLIEAYWSPFCASSPLESSIDIICNDEISSYNMMAIRSKDPRIINTNIVQELNKWSGLEPNQQKTILNQNYGSDGFVKRDGVVSEDQLDLITKSAPTLNVSQLYYFEKIISLALNNNVKPIVIRTPVTKRYFDALQNYDQVTDPIIEICDSYNVRFKDFNIELKQYSDSLFADKNHLNYQGVELFNKNLLKYLNVLN